MCVGVLCGWGRLTLGGTVVRCCAAGGLRSDAEVGRGESTRQWRVGGGCGGGYPTTAGIAWYNKLQYVRDVNRIRTQVACQGMRTSNWCLL